MTAQGFFAPVLGASCRAAGVDKKKTTFFIEK
jgi:hypothetical protein